MLSVSGQGRVFFAVMFAADLTVLLVLNILLTGQSVIGKPFSLQRLTHTFLGMS